MKAPLVAAVVALAPSLAGADDCAFDATQVELDACAGAAFAAADRDLNTLYSEMKSRLEGDPDTAHLLTLAQRAWIGWRDAECDLAAAGVTGGSIYPMIRAQCLAGLTTDRIADFRRYLSCEEGDISCPLPPP
jgi:uncharacterized protein YecT (DUF1311 family)